jgi:hypothetical protein
MFKARFTQEKLNKLVATVLIASVLSACSTSAVAQTIRAHALALSPASRQMLAAILGGLPPTAQPLVLNALRRIGPQRAEAQLAQARAMPPQTLAVIGQLVTQTLAILPLQSQQALIDGLFEVSPAEEQFAGQVLTQIAQTRIRMNAGAARVFAQGQAAKRQTDDATSCALGPNPYPGYYGNGYGYPCY